MSYPTSLDEYSEEALCKEMDLRRRRQRAGLCDCCGRLPSDPPCRFPERHKVRPSTQGDR